MRVTVIGGGILGTAHALEAVQRGHHVTQLEREVEARGATVRNFGLVWVSGRSAVELDAALRSRELWEDIGARISGVGFRPAGSLTLLRTPGEVAVAEAAAAGPDAARRGFELLDQDRVRALNPRCAASSLRDCTVRATVPSNRDRPCPPCVPTCRPPAGTPSCRVPRRARSMVAWSATTAAEATTPTSSWCALAPVTAD